MIKIENVVLPHKKQWEAVIRGMRNPLNSWDKSDSEECRNIFCGDCDGECLPHTNGFIIGSNDLDLMKRLDKAGTEDVIAIHGRMPTWDEINNEDLKYKTGIPVLYGDNATLYQKAYDLMLDLDLQQSYVMIVGTSFYTGISEDLYQIAEKYATKVWVINENASVKVPKVCVEIKELLSNGNEV